MNQYLADLWSDAYFGLVPFMSQPGEMFLRVRFVWLYAAEPLDAPSVESTAGRSLMANGQTRFLGVCEINVRTNLPIQSGDIFVLPCRSAEERIKKSTLLELRWQATVLQFLAGAAGVNIDNRLRQQGATTRPSAPICSKSKSSESTRH